MEEETVILVELTGLPNPDVIKQINGPCYILGVNTDSPVIQVGNFVFNGQYKDIIGSALLFEKGVGSNCLNYCGKSFKKVCASRVVLKRMKDQETHEQKDAEKTE